MSDQFHDLYEFLGIGRYALCKEVRAAFNAKQLEVVSYEPMNVFDQSNRLNSQKLDQCRALRVGGKKRAAYNELYDAWKPRQPKSSLPVKRFVMPVVDPAVKQPPVARWVHRKKWLVRKSPTPPPRVKPIVTPIDQAAIARYRDAENEKKRQATLARWAEEAKTEQRRQAAAALFRQRQKLLQKQKFKSYVNRHVLTKAKYAAKNGLGYQKKVWTVDPVTGGLGFVEVSRL
jgi:hypothetical protein